MKKIFYRTEEMAIGEWGKIVSQMREFLKGIGTEDVLEEELMKILFDLIGDQDGKGVWGLFDEKGMPSEAKIDFIYTPTYISSAILMKSLLMYPKLINNPEFINSLKTGLSASVKYGFCGHGYDALDSNIDAMNIFIEGGLGQFLNEYSNLCIEFTKFISGNLIMYENALRDGNTFGAWGNDYSGRIEETIMQYDESCYVNLFVYGTLLRNQHNHNLYLSDSNFIDEGVLSDFALYNLGTFPGICRKNGQNVKGEVYRISKNTLKNINLLEGEGSLYSLEKVKIILSDETVIDAFTYVYLHNVDDKNMTNFDHQPWGKYVWYASYGSNLLFERFMCYVEGGICRFNNRSYNGCNDKTAPRESRPLSIPYSVYFANNSSSWENAGVCFLDTSKPGNSLGRMYLVTREQMKDIGGQEGIGEYWYNHIETLGTYKGIPIETITNKKILPVNNPGSKYLDVLAKGLQETYPEMSVNDIDEYIAKIIGYDSH